MSDAEDRCAKWIREHYGHDGLLLWRVFRDDEDNLDLLWGLTAGLS